MLRNAAVITGDLIGSTRVEPVIVDRAMQALAGAAAKVSRWAHVDTRFSRFRGDGWQMYLADHAFVLRATQLLVAELRSIGDGIATRMSVAVGAVDRLGETGLAEAAGPAFSLSGRNLDRMPSFRTFVYAEPDKTDHWRPATMDLAVWQARQWTPEQAEAVALALALPRPTDESLARDLGITRQAFQARLKGSGIAAASHALLAFEIERQRPET